MWNVNTDLVLLFWYVRIQTWHGFVHTIIYITDHIGLLVYLCVGSLIFDIDVIILSLKYQDRCVDKRVIWLVIVAFQIDIYIIKINLLVFLGFCETKTIHTFIPQNFIKHININTLMSTDLNVNYG